ncbi:MAG: lysophospholipid acyltransferase family protein [Pseudomonadota bacterium]
MSLWKGPPEHVFAPPPWYGRLVGSVRVVVILSATLLAIALMVLLQLAGRVMRTERAIEGLARLWSRFALRGLGLAVEIRGTPLQTPSVVVANHTTWLDTLALRTGPFLTFVAKAEVADWPLFGQIAKINNTLFVARKASEAKRQEADMAERLAQGERLIFFPEGTSSDALRVLPFKSSLFSTFCKPPMRDRIHVQPVALAWIAPEGQPSSFYGWWGDMGLERNIWDIATRSFGGRLIITWCPPLSPADFSDRKALALAAETAVAEALVAAGVDFQGQGKVAWGEG